MSSTHWFDDSSFGGPARRLNVSTLTGLRALGAFGQTVAVLVAGFGLSLPIPVLSCFAIILASVLVSIAVRARFRPGRRLDDTWATTLLAFDALQLAALLSLTGGLVNPFSVLLLAPVITAASALPLRNAAVVLALTIIASTIVSIWYLPLPLGHGDLWQEPVLIRIGAFVAIAVSATFIAFYAYRVAEESRVLASALAATELALAREQHLSQLDGLAAAAAHELGTPLATIALVAHEMEASQEAQKTLGDDLKLLKISANRCRDILAKLSSPQEMAKGGISETALSALLEEIAAPRRLLGVAITVDCQGDGPEPVLSRNPGALFGLGNIVENGVDHARGKLTITARWSATRLNVVIEDDGPGFPPQVLQHMGEPYISTPVVDKFRDERREGSGMGLGLFIAIALLERSGASVSFANGVDAGARVQVAWPRGSVEADRRASREALESAMREKSER